MFSGSKESEKNEAISLLLIKFLIIDLSIKNEKIIKILIIMIVMKDNLNDIENISLDERDVT